MSFECETGVRPSAVRSRTVRVEMDSGRYVDFVRFDAGLDVDRMLLLETVLRDAGAEAAEGTAPGEILASALARFKSETGVGAMVCPAPYLFDLVLE